jgi:hypothetical protein
MTMCKKLIILCVALIVVGLSVKAPASYIGQEIDSQTGCIVNPLKVDIDAESGWWGEPAEPLCGWQGWIVPGSWTNPSKEFDNPYAEYAWEIPGAQLEGYRMAGASGPSEDSYGGGGRTRSGGLCYVAGTGEFQSTSKGFGMNYMKLTLTGLAPETNYRIYLWSYEATNVWSVNTDNPNSKYIAWSTTNPKTWLEANGYGEGGPNTSEPNGGYGPIIGDYPITDSNMPCDLKNMSKRLFCQAPEGDSNDYVGGLDYRATFCCVMSNSDGVITLYGWMDATDWGGSMHVPLNGFFVVPEPATVALLGLGGLALIRRRKR